MKSWLYSQCMHVNVWRKNCKLHQGEAVFALVTVLGIDDPSSFIASITAVTENTDTTLPTVSLELLNMVFRANIPTVSSIPPKCRLHFKRTFKSVLQRVVASPKELSSWIHLFFFPGMHSSYIYSTKQSGGEVSQQTEAAGFVHQFGPEPVG